MSPTIIDELDQLDRALLRALLKANRPVSTSQAASMVGIGWKAADNHLKKLFKNEFVYPLKEGKEREYKRGGKTVKARSVVKWIILCNQTAEHYGIEPDMIPPFDEEDEEESTN